MIKRIITAALLAPVFLAFLFWGDIYFGFMVLALALAGMSELNILIIKLGCKALSKVNFFSTFLLIMLTLVTGGVYYTALALYALFLLYAFLPLFYFQKISFKDSAVNFWGIIYLGGFFSFLPATRLLPQGFFLTLMLVLGVWMGDIAAYFIGLKFGRHQLTVVSPQKTWEGAIGGFLATLLAVILLSTVPFNAAAAFSWRKACLAGVIISFFGQLGDLSQSALKREAGVKDSGTLLPGHGGILDRFDGLLFAAPAFYLFYCLVL
jgi:phosphatidate cytidylyltransferase